MSCSLKKCAQVESGTIVAGYCAVVYQIKTVYCSDRNQQMQSKYSCSQSIAKSCLLKYKIPIWIYTRQTFPQKQMFDVNELIWPWKIFRGGGRANWCQWMVPKSLFQLHYESILYSMQQYRELWRCKENMIWNILLCCIHFLIIA